MKDKQVHLTLPRSALMTLIKALHPDGIQDPKRRQQMDDAMKILNIAIKRPPRAAHPQGVAEPFEDLGDPFEGMTDPFEDLEKEWAKFPDANKFPF
jgi:hypothetical protein